MKSLLIVAHGSRRQKSNDEVRSLGDKVFTQLHPEIDSVEVAFLEFSASSIEVALDDCFNSNTDELIVLPYFLSGGNHVARDVPQAINAAMEKWPDKSIKILPHIGAIDFMPALISIACKR